MKHNETCGLMHTLKLKCGITYMLTNNVDTSDGLVNGACSVLKQVDVGVHNRNNITWKPLRVWIQIEDSRKKKQDKTTKISMITLYQMGAGLQYILLVKP